MMQIVYYSKKEQFLRSCDDIHGEKIFISPSPGKADGLRSLLPEKDNSQVVTISHFAGSLIHILWNPEDKIQVKRKSELLLVFGILKNKFFKDLSFEEFIQAYNLFSDIRSFSLDLNALSTVLEEWSPTIKNAVKLFWEILDLSHYLDEHAAYHQMAQKLRFSDEIEALKKVYIFWGFQQLNGQQIDFLKALSLRYKVIIPLPIGLRDKLKISDWPIWLKDHQTVETTLPELVSFPKAKWVVTNSREIALNLKDYLKNNDQIILGVNKLAIGHLHLVPSREVRFKIPHDFLKTEIKQVFNDIITVDGGIGDLKKYIQSQILNFPSFKKIKAWQLYLEAIENVEELTDEIIQVNSFFHKLLYEVVKLNSPRTYFASTSANTMSIDLSDMSSLESIDRKRRILLCLDDRFEEIQSLGQNYTENIQKILSGLGPVKRNELDFLFKRWELEDLFSQGDAWVFMGDETLKHSVIWKRLFQGIELEAINESFPRTEKKISDHLSSFTTKQFKGLFSASKLQGFVDCPRKFYFSYVDRVFPQVLLKKDFDPLTSGIIVHEIIETFFKQKMSINELPSLVKKTMDSHVDEKKLLISSEVFLQKELTFRQRSRNGIDFIHQLDAVNGDRVNWKIEEGFNISETINLTGQIDCLGVSEKYIFLLDFKSTESAASTTKEILSLEAIQLWVYALAAQKKVDDFQQKSLVLGYVVLDNPSKSVLLSDDEDVVRNIKSFSRSYLLKDELGEMLEATQARVHSIATAIQNESLFPPKPRKSSTCQFCDISSVCIKSEINNVPVT